MATNAYIAHEDGTPFTEAELVQDEKDHRCPDCDALSAAQRADNADNSVDVRRVPTGISIPQPDGVVAVRKRPDASGRHPAARFVTSNPAPCPKHVLRPHPWLSAISLKDLDDEILQNFVQGVVNGTAWVPMLAGPSNFPKGFCYEDREFSQEEIRVEIERRKNQPARVENATQKYLRLSRVPQFWITDGERRFLQSREAALCALKLRMK